MNPLYFILNPITNEYVFTFWTNAQCTGQGYQVWGQGDFCNNPDNMNSTVNANFRVDSPIYPGDCTVDIYRYSSCDNSRVTRFGQPVGQCVVPDDPQSYASLLTVDRVAGTWLMQQFGDRDCSGLSTNFTSTFGGCDAGTRDVSN